jgi:hypothetical protein
MDSKRDPLRVFALFSGGASAVKYLLDSDPGYESVYEIAGAFTDNPQAPGIALCRSAGIPIEESYSVYADVIFGL